MADDGVVSLRAGELDIARVSRQYVLGILQDIARSIQMDHVSTLLFLAISEANGRRSGCEDRPVSLYAVSRAYGLSYETARRHLMKLMAGDLVERRGDGGVVVPKAVFLRPDSAELFARQIRRTEDLLATLPGRGRSVRLAVTDDLARAAKIIQAHQRYVLQILQLANAAVSRDFLTTLVFLAVAQLVSEQHAFLGDKVPDSQTSVYAVARRLDLPYETARRHVTKLEKAGFCTRYKRGIALAQDLHEHQGADDYLVGVAAATRDFAAAIRALA